jgi:predicted alpha/beta hydrolase
VLGHSLGGQAALLHLALSAGEADIDGVVLMAVGLPHWRWYPGRRRHGVLAITQSIGAASAVLGVWPGWGFGGRQARGVMRDWAYTARTGRFPRLDGVDVEAALRDVRTPVLAISVDRDQFTPHETLDQLCAKLASAPLTRERHAIVDADHFTWVRSADGIAARVAQWAGIIA